MSSSSSSRTGRFMGHRKMNPDRPPPRFTGKRKWSNTTGTGNGCESKRNREQDFPTAGNSGSGSWSGIGGGRERGFGFMRLYKFLEDTADHVLLSINKDKTEWKALLESDDLTGDKLIIAIQVLGEKVCADVPVLQQQQINALTAGCSARFIEKVETLISSKDFVHFNKNVRERFKKQSATPVDSDPGRILQNVHTLCSFVLKTMPSVATDHFYKLITIANGVATVCNPTSVELELPTKFQGLLQKIGELSKEEIAKKEVAKGRLKKSHFDDTDMAEFDAETPPNSIKDIAVIPSIEELLQKGNTFLRPNKSSGFYNDSSHYLDVQFRLFRADFVRPLQKGIQIFMKDRKDYISERKRMPLGEIRLYTGVTLLGAEMLRECVAYKLQLNPRVCSRIKWEKSKKFLPGSLILMTTVENCFQSSNNTHFGLVLKRDPKELQQGILTVTWEGAAPLHSQNHEYLLFESEVYLEAYRHTLETLKKLELEKFPMKKFIVDASNTVELPEYLRVPFNKMNFRLRDRSEKSISPLLEIDQWPTAEEFGFDGNQFEAFHAALTKEFSIIQGPPGTGKTFLGLKIAEVLLSNKSLWKAAGEDSNPIIVVCYTNHALDQFLEGIMHFYQDRFGELNPKITRIGGRCNSEALSKFTLREARFKMKGQPLNYQFEISARKVRQEVSRLENLRKKGLSEIVELAAANLQGIVDFEKISAWEKIRHLFPNNLWEILTNLDWLGIEAQRQRTQLRGVYDARELIYQTFRVRDFPAPVAAQPWRIHATSGNAVEMIQSDDKNQEEYDLDELMANRVTTEEIWLEVERKQQKEEIQQLAYLPDSSVENCAKRLEVLEMDLQNKNVPRQFQDELCYRQAIISDRKLILEEMFRLYNRQMLELPDVTNILEAIKRTEGIVWKLEFYFNLKLPQRWAIYFQVVEIVRQQVLQYIPEVEHRLRRAQKELHDVSQWGDGLILKNSDVVGLTTTGAAKYNNLLRMMRSKIVIVEEAAEVFEAHVVTCITEQCQQLILIGDHLQLRPNPTVYDLAKKYNLDLSLFERMINNDLHCYQLKVQHRMRPQIADLIRGTIYDDLQDDESVKKYPDVKGVTKNIFFLAHSEKELSEADTLSKSNVHEAQFLAALCRHLVLQGYDPKQITILTMYTGQMFLLRKKVGQTPSCFGVKVTCVDNFQGEESDIILLSLVRSNDDGKIGFVGVDNRICVALSRAKHGLYVIGNMEAIKEKSKTWKAINDKLEAIEAVGTSLELECAIHQRKFCVKTAEEFRTVAPEGGCTEMCAKTLSCSHKCPLVCHAHDVNHEEFQCKEKCLRPCENQLHHCEEPCYKKCPPCIIVVDKELPCGHRRMLRCCTPAETYKCKVIVDKTLEACGHVQKAKCCLSLEEILCQTLVPKVFPKCGHERMVLCHKKDKEDVCLNRCEIRLDCGHECAGSCHAAGDPQHLTYKCKKNCAKECLNGHECKVRHLCHEKCPPCIVKIPRSLACGHEKSLNCGLDLSKYKCMEKCERELAGCSHKCTSPCSEVCPLCQTKVIKVAPCGHKQKILCHETPTKEKCKVVVAAKNAPACGHSGLMVSCSLDESSSGDLLKFCKEPCNFKFNDCDHVCGGTCKSCLHGRVHLKCQTKCGRPLVCGHRCNVPCSAVCPPCQQPCLMKCEHSKCYRRCGDPCTPCKEKCKWCTKRCGELCNRKPCDVPCPKKLKCGHDCVGFCGEPCPPLCRKCDWEELTSFCLLGNEEEENARFVYLPDCGHTIEVEGLKSCLTISPDNQMQIRAKQCPKCNTVIRNCRRFGNLIKRHCREIEEVKARSLGDREQRRKIQKRLINEVNSNVQKKLFLSVWNKIRSHLLDRVYGREFPKRVVDEFSMKSLEFIVNAAGEATNILLASLNAGKLTTQFYEKVIEAYEETFMSMLERQPLSRQEFEDFNGELTLLDYFRQLLERRSLSACNPTNENAYSVFV